MNRILAIPSRAGYDIPGTLDLPAIPATGTTIMVHGIFSDRDEHGRYIRQAALHNAAGRRTIRFDWQGHGRHPVSFLESSIAGNVDDLQSVIDFCEREWGDDLSIVASSFGGAIFLLHQQTPSRRNFSKVVLLNPVTDFRHTFYDHVGGELMEEFSAKNWEQVFSHGQVTLLPGKTMSRRLAVELLTLKPYLGFDNLESPTMVLHGSADTSVSSELTRINSARSKLVTFREIPGANHAFASPWEEKETFSLIRQWFAH